MAARSPVVRHSRNSNKKKAKRIKESGKNNVRQAGKRLGAKKRRNLKYALMTLSRDCGMFLLDRGLCFFFGETSRKGVVLFCWLFGEDGEKIILVLFFPTGSDFSTFSKASLERKDL